MQLGRQSSNGASQNQAKSRSVAVRSRLSNNEGVADADSESDNSEEDGLGEEPPEMRVSPEFLKNLPGVQASDSMGYRIEALRVYLPFEVNPTKFILYHSVQ